MINLDSTIRRTDLNFRGEYFNLKTTIYRIAPYKYQIFCEDYRGDFEALKYEFNQSFRQISCPVDLTNIVPVQFEAILPAIKDKEIDFAGIFNNEFFLFNTLLSKFPDLSIYKVSYNQNRFGIHVDYPDQKTTMGKQIGFMPLRDRSRLETFLNALQMDFGYDIIETHLGNVELPETPKLVNYVQELVTNRWLTKQVTGFSERDDALWFDSAPAVYDGSFNKKQLYFLNDNDYACYADFSTWGNINLRNFLLLYNKVYITPPFEKSMKEWLSGQHIKVEHFSQLLKDGRICLLLSQPESRYDIGFIKECYQVNPASVVTRRALATLQMYNLVSMGDQYILQDENLIRELPAYCEGVAGHIGWEASDYYDLLMWPLKAKRRAFDALNFSGIYGTGGIGINTVIEKWISKKSNHDLALEFSLSAANIHLSHALNATYFPYTGQMGKVDSACANIMGNFLNLAKLSTMKQLKAGALNLDSRQQVTPINPVDIFKLSEFADLDEFEAEMKRSMAYPRGKFLMETLASLSEEKRAKKIVYYNKQVEKLLKKHDGKAFSIDLGTNVVLDTIGIATGYPFLGSGWSILKKGGQGLAKLLPGIKTIENKLEEAFHKNPDKANIHFLAQINRVAKLKKED
jgi:hypothetical protein